MKNAFAKFTFVIVLAFAVSVSAQSNCEILPVNAPLLLNLRLGMSPEEVRNAFGNALKIKIKKNGERIFFQNYIKNPAPAALKNVRALYLRFYDRKLYQIELFYEPRTDLPNLESIAQTLAAQLNFLPENWQIKNARANLSCGENSLKADNILNPHIELTNETTRRIVEEKRKQK